MHYRVHFRTKVINKFHIPKTEKDILDEDKNIKPAVWSALL